MTPCTLTSTNQSNRRIDIVVLIANVPRQATTSVRLCTPVIRQIVSRLEKWVEYTCHILGSLTSGEKAEE